MSPLNPLFAAGFAVCITAASAAPVVALAPARETVYWSGSSGGYRWRWTSRDITANRPGTRQRFSLKRRMYPSFNPEGYTSFNGTATPLSLVGSILTIRNDEYWEGGAHPSGSVTYASVDVAKPQRPLSLTDLFSQAQVRDALWADPIIRKVLSKAGVKSKPATAAALAKALELQIFEGPEESEYQFMKDFLNRFSFHHLEGERVAVRMNVSWGAEVYRFHTTEIGILLPIPAHLRTRLRSAAAGREGFLTRTIPKSIREKGASLVEAGQRG